MLTDKCAGEHRIHVAAGGTSINKVWIVTVCLQCGKAAFHEFPVETPEEGQVPVFFNVNTGELVIPDKNKRER